MCVSPTIHCTGMMGPCPTGPDNAQHIDYSCCYGAWRSPGILDKSPTKRWDSAAVCFEDICGSLESMCGFDVYRSVLRCWQNGLDSRARDRNDVFGPNTQDLNMCGFAQIPSLLSAQVRYRISQSNPHHRELSVFCVTSQAPCSKDVWPPDYSEWPPELRPRIMQFEEPALHRITNFVDCKVLDQNMAFQLTGSSCWLRPPSLTSSPSVPTW